MKFTHIALILLALAGANGCAAAGRIKNIGKAPDLSPTENPAALYGGRAIAMPMPVTPRHWPRPMRIFLSVKAAGVL
ncbi:MAG TPA: hypothetical protein PKM48_15030, partial [Parvularculaceae bacterium]|nr:hypothetical protein [Parvularculaceae bacterium]